MPKGAVTIREFGGVNLFKSPRDIADNEFTKAQDVWEPVLGELETRPRAFVPSLTYYLFTATGVAEPVISGDYIVPQIPAFAQFIASDENHYLLMSAANYKSDSLGVPGGYWTLIQAGYTESDEAPFIFANQATGAEDDSLGIGLRGSAAGAAQIRPAFIAYNGKLYVFMRANQGEGNTSSGCSPILVPNSLRPGLLAVEGQSLNTWNESAAPTVATVFNDQFVLAGFEGNLRNLIRNCNPAAPQTIVPIAKAISVGDSSEAITGLAVTTIYGGDQAAQQLLLVFKEKSVWILKGFLPTTTLDADIHVSPLLQTEGCLFKETIVKSEYGLIWASHKNVWLYTPRGELVPVGENVSNELLETPEKNVEYGWHAVYWRGHYLLTVPKSAPISSFSNAAGLSSYDACQWWCDLRNFPKQVKWWGPMSIPAAASIVVKRPGLPEILLFATTDGKQFTFFDERKKTNLSQEGANNHRFRDVGRANTPFETALTPQAEVRTKEFDFGDGALKKIYVASEVEAQTEEPYRVELEGVSTAYVSTPDSSANSVVGDVAIRAKVSADDWTPTGIQTLVAKWHAPTSVLATGYAYLLQLLPNGRLLFSWSTDGVNSRSVISTAALPAMLDGGLKHVGVALDVNVSGTSHEVKFYTSDDGGEGTSGTWTQLGSTVSGDGTTSIFNSTEQLLVGMAMAATATMDLDFINNWGGATTFLTTNGTFTRSGATATRVNASGLIEAVAADTARRDFDPVSMAARGILLEGTRTNIALRSEEFDNATWTKGDATISANATTAKDGNTTADKLVENTANASHFALQSFTLSDNTIYAASMFIKQAGRTQVRMEARNKTPAFPNAVFDVSNGTIVSTSGGGAFVAARIENYGDGWYRCILVINSQSGAGAPYLAVFLRDGAGSSTYTGDGTSGVYLWGAQLEVGATASSYVATTSASVTRNADVASITSLVAAAFNTTEGSIAADFRIAMADTVNNQYIASFSDNSNNELIAVQIAPGSAGRLVLIDGGVELVTASGGTVTTGATQRLAAAYKANDFAVSLNGGAATTDTSGTLPTVDRLHLGRDGSTGQQLNGHLQRLRYWPRRLPNSALVALSGGGNIAAADLEAQPFKGRVYEVDVINSAIITDPAVVDFNAFDGTPSTASWVSTFTGETWTLNGSAVVRGAVLDVRITGEGGQKRHETTKNVETTGDLLGQLVLGTDAPSSPYEVYPVRTAGSRLVGKTLQLNLKPQGIGVQLQGSDCHVPLIRIKSISIRVRPIGRRP